MWRRRRRPPTFEVALHLDATGRLVSPLVATTRDQWLGGFEWAWDGGEHVYISAQVEGRPFGFAIERPEGVEHTPQAFASFLSALYADPSNIRLLRRVWDQHPVRHLSPDEIAAVEANRVEHLAWRHAHRDDHG